ASGLREAPCRRSRSLAGSTRRPVPPSGSRPHGGSPRRGRARADGASSADGIPSPGSPPGSCHSRGVRLRHDLPRHDSRAKKSQAKKSEEGDRMTDEVLIAVLAACVGIAVGVLAMLRRQPPERDDTDALDALNAVNAVNAVNAQLHAELTARLEVQAAELRRMADASG